MQFLSFVALLARYALAVAEAPMEKTSAEFTCGTYIDQLNNVRPLFVNSHCHSLPDSAKFYYIEEGCSCAFVRANEICDLSNALAGPISGAIEDVRSYSCMPSHMLAGRKLDSTSDNCGNVIGSDFNVQPFLANKSCIAFRHPPPSRYFMPGFCTCTLYTKPTGYDTRCSPGDEVFRVEGPAHGKIEVDAYWYLCSDM